MKTKAWVNYNVNYSTLIEIELPDDFTYQDNSEYGFGDIIENNLEVLNDIDIPENNTNEYASGSFEITHILKV